MNKIDSIIDYYPDDTFLKADGFDDALLGVWDNKLAYSQARMVDICIAEGMTYEEAIEYLEFNTWCAYVGDKTPIYIEDLMFYEPKI